MAKTAFSSARHLSLYDGTRFLGTIIVRGDKSCIAKDVNGRELGKFTSIQKASAAIDEAQHGGL